jgi:hypothetical protein
MKPMNDCTSFLFEGIGQSATPVIFTGSISTLLCEMMTPM